MPGDTAGRLLSGVRRALRLALLAGLAMVAYSLMGGDRAHADTSTPGSTVTEWVGGVTERAIETAKPERSGSASSSRKNAPVGANPHRNGGYVLKGASGKADASVRTNSSTRTGSRAGTASQATKNPQARTGSPAGKKSQAKNDASARRDLFAPNSSSARKAFSFRKNSPLRRDSSALKYSSPRKDWSVRKDSSARKESFVQNGAAVRSMSSARTEPTGRIDCPAPVGTARIGDIALCRKPPTRVRMTGPVPAAHAMTDSRQLSATEIRESMRVVPVLRTVVAATARPPTAKPLPGGNLIPTPVPAIDVTTTVNQLTAPVTQAVNRRTPAVDQLIQTVRRLAVSMMHTVVDRVPAAARPIGEIIPDGVVPAIPHPQFPSPQPAGLPNPSPQPLGPPNLGPQFLRPVDLGWQSQSAGPVSAAGPQHRPAPAVANQQRLPGSPDVTSYPAATATPCAATPRGAFDAAGAPRTTVVYQPGTPLPPGPWPLSSRHPGVITGSVSSGADSPAGTWATTSRTWHPALSCTGVRTADSERTHERRPASASPPG